MSELCLQIAVDAIPDQALGQIRRLCEGLARERRVVTRLRWSEVALTRRFLTAQFTTPDVDALWERIDEVVMRDPGMAEITDRLLVIATGQHGWNDSRHLFPPVSKVA